MNQLIFGISVSILLLGSAILLRNVGQPGRFRSVFAALLLCAALFAIAATLIVPFASLPKSLTTVAERILPQVPKHLPNFFHYHPTAQKPATNSASHGS